MQKGITEDLRTALSGPIAVALVAVFFIGGGMMRGSLEPHERP